MRKQNISHYNRKSPKMKKFSLSVLVELTKIYAEQEHQRERRGMIKNDWVKKSNNILQILLLVSSVQKQK